MIIYRKATCRVAHSFKEVAATYKTHYKSLIWQEGLHIANYLNSIAYNYSSDNPPRLDKAKFSARSHNE